jgi:hypothetical protein
MQSLPIRVCHLAIRAGLICGFPDEETIIISELASATCGLSARPGPTDFSFRLEKATFRNSIPRHGCWPAKSRYGVAASRVRLHNGACHEAAGLQAKAQILPRSGGSQMEVQPAI